MNYKWKTLKALTAHIDALTTLKLLKYIILLTSSIVNLSITTIKTSKIRKKSRNNYLLQMLILLPLLFISEVRTTSLYPPLLAHTGDTVVLQVPPLEDAIFWTLGANLIDPKCKVVDTILLHHRIQDIVNCENTSCYTFFAC